MSPSNSSNASAGFREKYSQAVTHFKLRWNEKPNPATFDSMFAELDAYRNAYQQYTGKRFNEARLYEIGYGARPWRLIALASMGIDVHGVDLDRPMLGFNFSRVTQAWRKNGFERALKSGVRSLLFDGKDMRALRAALGLRGYSMKIDEGRFNVCDAAVHDFGNLPIDFLYSETVLQHIPFAGVESIVERLSRKLSPNGLMMIMVSVYTGITGGLLPEWYPYLVPQKIERKSEPWEHLRKRRFTPNTYLNEAPRSAYRELFSRYFDLVEERVLKPDLGRQWLTPEVKADLIQWPDEELFSNDVQFVLRPRK